MNIDAAEAHRLLDLAMEELKKYGRAESARCPRCDGLIVITEIGHEAWTIECPCGEFHGSLRGL